MGRGTGNFVLQLAGFASRLGLSRCEDGNSRTKKNTGKNMLENERSVGMGHKMERANKNGTNAV